MGDEEDEELSPPPKPSKKRRPPPKEEHDSYSDEYNYKPHKRPAAPQVIVVQNTDKKAAVLEFLRKVGHKLNPLNVFGLNKKDDVVVYLDKPNQNDGGYDHRPLQKPRPKSTTTTTTTTPVPSSDTTTTTTTTSSSSPVSAHFPSLFDCNF